jgi:phosphatidylserine/phosphatidylglycerophosphate/cardiolipin synthase-like enzyme
VVLPDAPVPIDAVRAADRRVYLGGYTLTSERVAAELERAAERGVDVRVLVEGGPAGGAPRPEARLLDRLAAAGIDVAVVDGPRARYRFHHAKYLVADGRAVVTTENWERGGTGGRGNRGWAVTVDSRRFADRLAALFRADAGWRDGVDWREYRPNASFFEESTGGDAYPNRFPPLSARADVTLLAAPDNAERRVVDLIGEAEESVWIEQPSVDPDHPFVRAAVDAARRGVRVRVILGRAWYDREENRALVDDLNALAAREGLPLRAKLVERRSRFEQLHAKGLVVDDTALVGSINWNAVSTRENREVAALVESDRVADRYRRAMLADWRGGAWRIPVGVGVVALCATLAVAVLVRRVSFEGRRPGGSRRSRPPPSSR